MPSQVVPGLQARLLQLQPVVLSTLCSLLQGLLGSLGTAVEQNDQRTLSPVFKMLQTLRTTVNGLHSLAHVEGMGSAGLVGLLSEYALVLRLALPAQAGEEAALQISAVALLGIADLVTKHQDAGAARQMLAVLLPKLQAGWGGQGCCSLDGQELLPGSRAGILFACPLLRHPRKPASGLTTASCICRCRRCVMLCSSAGPSVATSSRQTTLRCQPLPTSWHSCLPPS